MLDYLANLNAPRKILWCYLLWWINTVASHFDLNPRLWLTSLGLSAIIGIALWISTRTSSTGTTQLDRWQIFRLFLMPFCVSSFAALVRPAGFILVFPPRLVENLTGAALIAVFLAATYILRALRS